MSRTSEHRTNFTVLLLLLGAVLVVGPLLAKDNPARFWMEAAAIVAMAAAVVLRAPGRWIGAAAAAAGVATLVAVALRHFFPSDFWIVASHLGVVAFVLLVAASITHTVWQEREVTADTILGGVTVYFLFVIAWSAAYQCLEFGAPGSFAVANADPGRWGAWETSPGVYPRLFFFSFVTLTTLGYGDLVPASIPAAGLAVAEAIVGPLYLTILIARLVGLHIAGGRSGAGGSEPPG